MSLERITVPIDFSPPSEAAARLASSLAVWSGARVALLHVDPIPGFATITAEPMYVPPQVFEAFRRDRDAEIEREMKRIEDQLGDGIEIESVIRRDDAVDGIVGYAAEHRSDLIVMGSHGRGATRFLVGSVAEKVSRQAPCPVLVTRRKDEGVQPRGPFRRVLVGVDYSRFSPALVELAREIMDPAGAIELVHVWTEPYLTAYDKSAGTRSEVFTAVERGRAREAHRLEAFARQVRLERTSHYLASGSPPRALLHRAEEIGADLIVVGAHGRERLSERVLGTVADRVLRHAEIPVLLLPEGAL
jgi:nucleotide-binding universal stress UspA family protein